MAQTSFRENPASINRHINSSIVVDSVFLGWERIGIMFDLRSFCIEVLLVSCAEIRWGDPCIDTYTLLRDAAIAIGCMQFVYLP